MPGLDGLEVARRMRRLAPLTEVPIVLVSASSAGLNAHQCREVGADAFLRKPIDVDRLLDTMGGLMGLVWMEAETNTEPG